MADDTGKFVVANQERMEQIRSTFDTHCQEVAELVLPAFANFQNRRDEKGAKRTQRLYEGTAPVALDRYASALVGFTIPAGERWQRVVTTDDELNKRSDVKEYLDLATDTLFRVRYDPNARFEGSVHRSYMGLGAFGNGVVFTDERVEPDRSGFPALRLVYRSIPFSQCYFKENHQGLTDWVHRRHRLTVRQAAAFFGAKQLPETMVKFLETDPETEFDFIHCVKPNDDFVPGALGPRGMAFSSFHVAMDEMQTMRRSGYRTLRYAVARGPMAPGEIYGRGPAMTILPEIKTINEMRRAILRQQHLSLSPPTLLASQRSAPLRLTPAALNYGLVTQEGRPLALPFQMGENFQPVEIEMSRIRQLINDTFLISLFQILTDRPQQTATETLQRAKEQGILIGPTISRLHAEFFGEMTRSELDIFETNGVLPEMPDVLREAGDEIQFTYESEITRAQRVASNEGYQQWLDANGEILAAKPHLMDVVDHEFMLRRDATSRGVPQKGIRSEEDLAKLFEAEQQAAQAQAELEQAPDLARAARDAAEAQNTAGGGNVFEVIDGGQVAA